MEAELWREGLSIARVRKLGPYSDFLLSPISHITQNQFSLLRLACSVKFLFSVNEKILQWQRQFLSGFKGRKSHFVHLVSF